MIRMVIVPPTHLEVLCITALVTSSEVSRTAESRTGGKSPSALATNARASRTCSGRPGIVRLPSTAAPAMAARSSVASLARVAVRAIPPAPLTPPCEKTGEFVHSRAKLAASGTSGDGAGSTPLWFHDAVTMHRTQVHSTNHGGEISHGIARVPTCSCIVNGKQVHQAALILA